MPLVVIVMVVIGAFFTGSELFKTQNNPVVIEKVPTLQIPTPTPTNPPTPTPTNVPQVKGEFIQRDPIIDCVGPDGGHLRITQKACDDFNNAWKKPQPSNIPSVPAQTSTKTDTATQIQVATPFYCKTVAGDILVSSIEECDQTRNGFFDSKLKTDDCMKEKQKPLDSCDNACDSKHESDRAICEWAYTGVNAGMQQDGSKYGQCLTEASDIWWSCKSKCTDDWLNQIKVCSLPR